MKELVKVSNEQTISARELYEYLEIQSRFNDWIRNRIEKYGFTENQDFVTLTKNLVSGGIEKDYALTLDCAKELSMVEGNEKGKQARQYFIEVEKAAKALTQKTDIELMIDGMGAMQRILQEKNEKIMILTPKAEYFDEVLQSENTYDVVEIAKELGTSAIKLNKKLAELRIQYKNRKGVWLLYAEYQNKGYTKTTTELYANKNVNITVMRTVWTEAGRKFIHSIFNNNLVACAYSKIGTQNLTTA